MRKVFCEVLGTELNLPENCQRIVSLSPAVTEALFEMGLGDKVVGVSTFCVHPPEAFKKPHVGSYNKIKHKLLKELNPDLIFTTTGYQRQMALELAKEYPVYAIPLPPTISHIISFCTEAGIVAGYVQNARTLQKNLLKHVASIEPVAKPTSVYLGIDLGGPVSFGMYSYITDALEFVGLRSIFGNKPVEWLMPEPKEIIESNPDIIIYEPKMFSKKNRTVEEVVSLFEKRGLGELEAVRNRRIIITPVETDYIAHHGPSFITKVLPWLVKSVNSLIKQDVI
ncbi:MAG: ABC transporter substrate-binding protein [Chlorobi bacterium]|nr:ABC transporter substrate-binding protein [Chlorobiota bacterium]